MTEYIDKDALLKDLNDRYKYRDLDCWGLPYTFGFQSAIDIVSKALPLNVAIVKHGQWNDIPNTYMSVASKDGTYHGNATSCSVCHEVNPNAYKTNYCPNCGAKMDGGADNETD